MGGALASLPTEQEALEDALGVMADIAKLRHFTKHSVLLTTLWTVLPDIARSFGSKVFGRYVGRFAESLAYSAACADALTVAAAKSCAAELARLVGRDAFA